jgi:uncharacterized protein (DUF1499 family)
MVLERDRLMSTARAGLIAIIVSVAFAAALVAAFMVVVAGPAYRMQLLDLRGSFTLIRSGAWIGLGAGVIALAGAWLTRPRTQRRGFALAVAGVVTGALTFAVPFALSQSGRAAPPIHDITTDTDRPPPFVALIPLRSGAPNGVDYGGEAVAKQQHAAFPDIAPVVVAEPPAKAFERALAAARDLGWEIAAAVPQDGRIEATDTTAWFGFKDDIVVRITPEGAGSRIDVRSVSRLGKSDLGKNAKRVRAYLARLRR